MQFCVIELNLIMSGQGSQNPKITLFQRPLFSLIFHILGWIVESLKLESIEFKINIHFVINLFIFT